MGRKGSTGKHKIEGISVFVRVRPVSVYEEAEGDEQVVDVNQGGTCLSIRNDERPHKAIQCAFDKVFNPDSTQEHVFNGLIPALDTVLEGYNACVLAYGQTGSGKTHTLIGPGGGTKLSDLPEDWGVIPRAVQFLFDRLAAAAEEDETFVYSVTCSFLQIYNENIVDLLQDRGHCDGSSLQIREESAGCGGGHGSNRPRRRNNTQSDAEGGWCSGSRGGRRPGALNENRRVFVNGLSSFRVGRAQDVLRYINIGATNRRVRATQHNEASSRSHAVMQLMVEAESSGGAGAGAISEVSGSACGEHVTYRQAKLSLVDLAGSEKMNSALNITRGHFNELRSINQSLSTLGNVVSALSEKHRTHVPYRDSKLTRLLQDSLGGNTRTTIIACVSPLTAQRNETVSTLQFADRAKKVMVRLRPNEVVDDRVLLARAQAEIVRLKQLLRQALDSTLRADADNEERAGTMKEPSRENHGIHHIAEKTKEGEEENYPATPFANNFAGSKEVLREAVDDSVVLQGKILDGKGGISAETFGTPSVSTTATKQRQLTRLMAENENLREDNDRLRAEVQRLVVHERQRQKQKKRHRRGCSSSGSSSRIGGVPLSSSPIDWSARYADAADVARRRRTPRSRCRSSVPESSPRAPSRAGSVSPSTRDASLTSVSASIPRFRRREFDDDYNRDGGEVRAIPEEAIDFSAEQLRDILGDNEEEEKKEETSDEKRKEKQDDLEATKQIERFRSELDRLAAGAFGSRGTNGVTERSIYTGEGEMVAQEVEKGQRLEDLMFEAEGRERQRVRKERARLTAVRAERLALEAQLASLTAITTGDSADALANPETAESPPIYTEGTTKPPTGDGYAVSGPWFSERMPVNGRAPVADVEVSTATSRTVVGKIEDQTDAHSWAGSGKPAAAGATATPVTTATRTHPEQSVSDKLSPPDIQTRSTIAPLRLLPAAWQTGWTTPPPRPRRSPSRRRPVTSAGTAAARTRSWRSRRRRRSESRSPVRVADGTHDPNTSENVRQSSLEGRRQQERGCTVSSGRMSNGNTSASTASMPGYSEAKLAALQTAYPPSPLSSSGGSALLPRKTSRSQAAAVVDRNTKSAALSNKLGERENRCSSDVDDRTGIGAQSATKLRAKLTYSLADRGLRLTVYSFRYDHYYECQIIGYDARRRMHRCVYDATGEKQWHDLRTKRFEIVGQNGVILRSTESAPQPTSTPLPHGSAPR